MIKRLFRKLFPLNDWQTVWHKQATWMDEGNPVAYCNYTIQFSESRGKFRLIDEGHLPRDHGYRSKAIEILRELEIGYSKFKAKKSKQKPIKFVKGEPSHDN